MSRATNCHCCNTVWFLASFWNIMTSVDFSTEFLCNGFHQNCSYHWTVALLQKAMWLVPHVPGLQLYWVVGFGPHDTGPGCQWMGSLLNAAPCVWH